MTTKISDGEKSRFKEAMLKELALETSARSRRHHRAGLVMGGLAIAILCAGSIAIPFATVCFALAIWAMKDAYAADAELRTLQERMHPVLASADKSTALPT